MGLFGLFKKTLGEVPVPGEVTLELPAGKVTIKYEEERRGRSVDTSESGGKPWPGIPGGFNITVTPAGGGQPIPVNESWGSVESATRKRIGTRYGKVEIPAAGSYTITVAPFTASRELFDPNVTLKG